MCFMGTLFRFFLLFLNELLQQCRGNDDKIKLKKYKQFQLYKNWMTLIAVNKSCCDSVVYSGKSQKP